MFVLSSRRSRLRALHQDLSTRLFCVWVCTKHLCFCFGGHGMACRPSPHLTGHGLRPPAIVLLPSAKCLIGRHSVWSIDHLFGQFFIFGWPTTVHLLLQIFFMPAVLAGIHLAPLPYMCMEGFHSCLACLVSFARVILYKGRPSPPSLRVPEVQERALRLGFA